MTNGNPPAGPAPGTVQPQFEPPPAQAAASGGPPLVFQMHGGARGSYIFVGVLLILLIITIPFAIWIFIGSAGAKIEITDAELIARGFWTKRWKLASLRRLGVLAVPIIARGIGGAIARKKVGGDNAFHLCAQDDKGRTLKVMVSMFERYPEIINTVSARTGLRVEELKMGLLGPKWPT